MNARQLRFVSILFCFFGVLFSFIVFLFSIHEFRIRNIQTADVESPQNTNDRPDDNSKSVPYSNTVRAMIETCLEVLKLTET